MKILLAGATGAIGRPLVRAARRGRPRGRRRSPAAPSKARELDAAGADGVVCDVLDRDAVLRVVARRRSPTSSWTRRPRCRSATTPRAHGPLLQGHDPAAAARHAEPHRGRARGRARGSSSRASRSSTRRTAATGLKTEDDPPSSTDAPRAVGRRAAGRSPRSSSARVDLGGVVLRYGMFYGPGTHFDDGGQIAEDVASAGASRSSAAATGVFSFIHVDDAAAATVRALDWEGSGILNIVDDEPLAGPRVAARLRARRSARRSRSASRRSSPSASPARCRSTGARRCPARRTRRPSASSAGSRATAASARAAARDERPRRRRRRPPRPRAARRAAPPRPPHARARARRGQLEAPTPTRSSSPTPSTTRSTTACARRRRRLLRARRARAASTAARARRSATPTRSRTCGCSRRPSARASSASPT